MMNLRAFDAMAAEQKKTARQPVMFIGHGSPMNIVRDNAFTQSLKKLGEQTEKPNALLVVSAHWLTPGQTAVSTNPKPETIYDFGGFPDELYQIKYPAPGKPDVAHEVAQSVKSLKVHEDHEMGLDHGAWSILRHIWPKADVPVFQLSIDYGKPMQFHYDLGKELRSLRDKGVMILGSGNIVHNLRRIDFDENAKTFDWAQEFDAWSKEKLVARDDAALVAYDKQATARVAHPTNDHYLPLLYTLGALDPKEQVRFTHESFQNASISMRCFESAKA
jgi:4,5-DOPA dioxygenase extradiol